MYSNGIKDLPVYVNNRLKHSFKNCSILDFIQKRLEAVWEWSSVEFILTVIGLENWNMLHFQILTCWTKNTFPNSDVTENCSLLKTEAEALNSCCLMWLPHNQWNVQSNLKSSQNSFPQNISFQNTLPFCPKGSYIDDEKERLVSCSIRSILKGQTRYLDVGSHKD